MTNFDAYVSEYPFAQIAVTAERILPIDPAACILNCRRCMEAGVKWMYSVDRDLVPYEDTLLNLMDGNEFRDIVGKDLLRRMHLIRKLGNHAAHDGKNLTRPQAETCLENLFFFLDFISYCYSETYEERQFDHALLDQKVAPVTQAAPVVQTAPASEYPDVDLKALLAENAALKEQLTARREVNQPAYTPKPLDLSEADTRRIYIDAMLLDAGWTRGKDWIDENAIDGIRSKSGKGRADYVLYGDDGRPLAVIEAKRTCADPPADGRKPKITRTVWKRCMAAVP